MSALSTLMLQAFDTELLPVALGTSTRFTALCVFQRLCCCSRTTRCPILSARAPLRNDTRRIVVLDGSPGLATAFAPCQQLHRPMLRNSSTLYDGLHRCRHVHPRAVVGWSGKIRAWHLSRSHYVEADQLAIPELAGAPHTPLEVYPGPEGANQKQACRFSRCGHNLRRDWPYAMTCFPRAVTRDQVGGEAYA
ncbi:hypothetical protein EDB86DRAFT_1204122 [Lactarius hatsudake]|nr:hypothetical protein EDB86DRAFT_1204122 [Lactarius hatsudake]